MSHNQRKNSKDDAGGGLGFGTALLLGGGAAALGFLARGMWESYQEFQGQSSSSGGPSPRPPRPPNSGNTRSDWERNPDQNLGLRKKQRAAFRDQNIPDEMKCVVCIDNPREICVIPCGHVCLCEDCSEKIDKKCPVCQQEIRNKKVIYM